MNRVTRRTERDERGKQALNRVLLIPSSLPSSSLSVVGLGSVLILFPLTLPVSFGAERGTREVEKRRG